MELKNAVTKMKLNNTSLTSLLVLLDKCGKVFKDSNKLRNENIGCQWSNIMKLFESVLKLYQMLGINPSKSKRMNLFNWKNVLVIAVFIQGFIFTALYWIFEAESLPEGGESFYASVIEFANTTYMFVIALKMNNLVQLIENLEHFFEKSKFKQLIKVEAI